MLSQYYGLPKHYTTKHQMTVSNWVTNSHSVAFIFQELCILPFRSWGPVFLSRFPEAILCQLYILGYQISFSFSGIDSLALYLLLKEACSKLFLTFSIYFRGSSHWQHIRFFACLQFDTSFVDSLKQSLLNKV